MRPGRPFKTGAPGEPGEQKEPGEPGSPGAPVAPGANSPSRQPVSIRDDRGQAEYPSLVAIWRSAVLATHEFLAEEDFLRIEGALAEHYFPAVALRIAELDGHAVGFSGRVGEGIEMLFVDDAARGRGIGSALLRDAVERGGANAVDVNEQNVSALGFYRSHGFSVSGRSPLDGDGRPYPILHLRLSEPGSEEQNGASGALAAEHEGDVRG